VGFKISNKKPAAPHIPIIKAMPIQSTPGTKTALTRTPKTITHKRPIADISTTTSETCELKFGRQISQAKLNTFVQKKQKEDDALVAEINMLNAEWETLTVDSPRFLKLDTILTICENAGFLNSKLDFLSHIQSQSRTKSILLQNVLFTALSTHISEDRYQSTEILMMRWVFTQDHKGFLDALQLNHGDKSAYITFRNPEDRKILNAFIDDIYKKYHLILKAIQDLPKNADYQINNDSKKECIEYLIQNIYEREQQVYCDLINKKKNEANAAAVEADQEHYSNLLTQFLRALYTIYSGTSATPIADIYASHDGRSFVKKSLPDSLVKDKNKFVQNHRSAFHMSAFHISAFEAMKLVAHFGNLDTAIQLTPEKEGSYDFNSRFRDEFLDTKFQLKKKYRSKSKEELAPHILECFPEYIPLPKNLESVAKSLINLDARQSMIERFSGFPAVKALSFYLMGLLASDAMCLEIIIKNNCMAQIIQMMRFREIQRENEQSFLKEIKDDNKRAMVAANQTAKALWGELSNNNPVSLQLCLPTFVKHIVPEDFDRITDLDDTERQTIYDQLMQQGIITQLTGPGKHLKPNNNGLKAQLDTRFDKVITDKTLVEHKVAIIRHIMKCIQTGNCVATTKPDELSSNKYKKILEGFITGEYLRQIRGVPRQIKRTNIKKVLSKIRLGNQSKLSKIQTQELFKILIKAKAAGVGHVLYVRIEPRENCIMYTIINGGAGAQYHQQNFDETTSQDFGSAIPREHKAIYHYQIQIPRINRQANKAYLCLLQSVERIRGVGPQSRKIFMDMLYKPWNCDLHYWLKKDAQTITIPKISVDRSKSLATESPPFYLGHSIQLMGNCSIFNLNHLLRYSLQLSQCSYSRLQKEVVVGIAKIAQSDFSILNNLSFDATHCA
jgi:hypothetical protein